MGGGGEEDASPDLGVSEPALQWEAGGIRQWALGTVSGRSDAHFLSKGNLKAPTIPWVSSCQAIPWVILSTQPFCRGARIPLDSLFSCIS